MIKKVLSAILAASMLMGMGITAYAQDASNICKSDVMAALHQETIKSLTGDYIDNITIKSLFDFDGNEFELVETGGEGYYIFDRTSGKYLEQAPESPSPYLGFEGDLYYFGPMNYYQKCGNMFKHTFLPDEYDFTAELSEEVQTGFQEALDKVRANKDTELLSFIHQRSTNANDINEFFETRSSGPVDSYVPSSSYIKNAIYPPNATGTCGYTAACIVLNYWHKLKGNVIHKTFLDGSGNLKTSGGTLQDKLIEYGGGTSSSWGKTIRDAMIDYCNAYGVSATSTYYVTNWDIFAEVGRGRPVIVFGYFPGSPSTLSAKGNVFHAVTAYGTRTENFMTKLIVHYGWLGYEKVLLDSGLVGSSTQFVLN